MRDGYVLEIEKRKKQVRGKRETEGKMQSDDGKGPCLE